MWIFLTQFFGIFGLLVVSLRPDSSPYPLNNQTPPPPKLIESRPPKLLQTLVPAVTYLWSFLQLVVLFTPGCRCRHVDADPDVLAASMVAPGAEEDCRYEEKWVSAVRTRRLEDLPFLLGIQEVSPFFGSLPDISEM